MLPVARKATMRLIVKMFSTMSVSCLYRMFVAYLVWVGYPGNYLGQQRFADDRLGIAVGLRSQGDDKSLAMAELVSERN